MVVTRSKYGILIIKYNTMLFKKFARILVLFA